MTKKYNSKQTRSLAQCFHIGFCFDSQGTTVNNFYFFLSIVSQCLSLPHSSKPLVPYFRVAEIRRRFREFDLDGNGVVTFDEAHSVLKKELAFTSEQSLDLFSRYDVNKDHTLNYNEFCKFYHRIATRYVGEKKSVYTIEYKGLVINYREGGL